MAESPPGVDSGRFSVLDEDLGDTEVDEGGDTADLRERTVNESPANVSCAGRPTVSRRRLVLVSQQEVAPTVMDAPSAISRDLHAESNVESIPIDSESDTVSLPGNATLDQDDSIPVVEPLGSLSFSADARAAMSFFDTCEVEGEFMWVSLEHGSSSCFCHGFCCISFPVAVSCQKAI